MKTRIKKRIKRIMGTPRRLRLIWVITLPNLMEHQWLIKILNRRQKLHWFQLKLAGFLSKLAWSGIWDKIDQKPPIKSLRKLKKYRQKRNLKRVKKFKSKSRTRKNQIMIQKNMTVKLHQANLLQMKSLKNLLNKKIRIPSQLSKRKSYQGNEAQSK